MSHLVSHIENAKAAWGSDMPDWIEVLARRCDEMGLKKTQAVVGYSPATISYVLRRRYNAPLDGIEIKVRATLMAAIVNCPELGELSLSQCLEWREREKNFQATSSLRMRMLNACRQCPMNAAKGG